MRELLGGQPLPELFSFVGSKGQLVGISRPVSSKKKSATLVILIVIRAVWRLHEGGQLRALCQTFTKRFTEAEHMLTQGRIICPYRAVLQHCDKWVEGEGFLVGLVLGQPETVFCGVHNPAAVGTSCQHTGWSVQFKAASSNGTSGSQVLTDVKLLVSAGLVGLESPMYPYTFS